MRPIMLKFNNDRQERYRIRTAIYKSENGRIVSKKALTPEAKTHIQKMYKNQKIIQQIYPECFVGKVELKDDELFFEYLEGDVFSNEYEKALLFEDEETFIRLLKDQANMILSCSKENRCSFTETEEYRKVFGSGQAFIDQEAFRITNFEFTSHNILLQVVDGKWGLIDYEYVFDFPVPVALVLYHCIIKTNIWTIKNFTKLISIEQMLQILHIENSIEQLEAAWSSFDSCYGKSNIAEAKLRYLKGNDNVATLQSGYQQLQRENLGNKNYINILTENLGKQQEFIKVQEKEILDGKKEILEGKKEILEGKKEILEGKREILRQKSEILHQSAVIKMKDYQIVKQQEQLEQASEREAAVRSDLTETIQNLQNELQQFRQSVSWKVTAPVRKILDCLKR